MYSKLSLDESAKAMIADHDDEVSFFSTWLCPACVHGHWDIAVSHTSDSHGTQLIQ